MALKWENDLVRQVQALRRGPRVQPRDDLSDLGHSRVLGKASLDTLRRERTWELFPGFARAYATTEWMDPREKKALLAGIVGQVPGVRPGVEGPVDAAGRRRRRAARHRAGPVWPPRR